MWSWEQMALHATHPFPLLSVNWADLDSVLARGLQTMCQSALFGSSLSLSVSVFISNHQICVILLIWVRIWSLTGLFRCYYRISSTVQTVRRGLGSALLWVFFFICFFWFFLRCVSCEGHIWAMWNFCDISYEVKWRQLFDSRHFSYVFFCFELLKSNSITQWQKYPKLRVAGQMLPQAVSHFKKRGQLRIVSPICQPCMTSPPHLLIKAWRPMQTLQERRDQFSLSLFYFQSWFETRSQVIFHVESSYYCGTALNG